MFFQFQEKPDHDWYCYDCHKGGDIIGCSECWRVYHESCINEDVSEDNFVCPMCKVSTYLHFTKNIMHIIYWPWLQICLLK